MTSPIPHRIALWALCIPLVLAAACAKKKDSTTPAGNGCISRIYPQPGANSLSGSDLDSAQTLFRANNLSLAEVDLDFFSFGEVQSPSYSGEEAQITAMPFVNGLPVFQTEYLTFYAGKYIDSLSEDVYNGPAPNTDMTVHQTLDALRSLFLLHAAQSYTIGGPATTTPPPAPKSYLDSCLLATLGYLDASEIPGSKTPAGQALVKVWQVTGLQGGLPTVYITDSGGVAWGVVYAVP